MIDSIGINMLELARIKAQPSALGFSRFLLWDNLNRQSGRASNSSIRPMEEVAFSTICPDISYL
jgi:hypothetical protein